MKKQIIKILVLFIIIIISLSNNVASFENENNPYTDLIINLQNEGGNFFGINRESNQDPLNIFSPKNILKETQKNIKAYSPGTIFITGDEDWKKTLQVSTLAIFRQDEKNIKKYPLLFIHEEDTISPLSFISQWEESNKAHVFFTNNETKKQINEKIPIMEEIPYIDFWDKFSTVVVADITGSEIIDYTVGIHASIIASSINSPLIFLEQEELEQITNHKIFKTKNIILISNKPGTQYSNKLFKDYFTNKPFINFFSKEKNILPVVISDQQRIKEIHTFLRKDIEIEPEKNINMENKLIIFNPEDISLNSCESTNTISSKIKEEFNIPSQTKTIRCKHSLIVPYLALKHNQNILPIRVASYIIKGKYEDAIIKINKEIEEEFKNLNDNSVNYVTFIGSKQQIPFHPISKKIKTEYLKIETTNEKELESLNPETETSYSIPSEIIMSFIPEKELYIGTGRITGLSPSDSSSQVMKQTFIKNTNNNNFIGIFEGETSTASTSLPVNELKEPFIKKKFFDDIDTTIKIDSEELINKNHLEEEISSSDFIFFEGEEESELISKLFQSINNKKNQDIIFAIAHSASEEKELSIVEKALRKGFTNIIATTTKYSTKGQWNALNDLFVINYNSPVLFGDVPELIFKQYSLRPQIKTNNKDKNEFMTFSDPLETFIQIPNNALISTRKNEKAKAPPFIWYIYPDFNAMQFSSFYKYTEDINDEIDFLEKYYEWSISDKTKLSTFYPFEEEKIISAKMFIISEYPINIQSKLITLDKKVIEEQEITKCSKTTIFDERIKYFKEQKRTVYECPIIINAPKYDNKNKLFRLEIKASIEEREDFLMKDIIGISIESKESIKIKENADLIVPQINTIITTPLLDQKNFAFKENVYFCLSKDIKEKYPLNRFTIPVGFENQYTESKIDIKAKAKFANDNSQTYNLKINQITTPLYLEGLEKFYDFENYDSDYCYKVSMNEKDLEKLREEFISQKNQYKLIDSFIVELKITISEEINSVEEIRIPKKLFFEEYENPHNEKALELTGYAMKYIGGVHSNDFNLRPNIYCTNSGTTPACRIENMTFVPDFYLQNPNNHCCAQCGSLVSLSYIFTLGEEIGNGVLGDGRDKCHSGIQVKDNNFKDASELQIGDIFEMRSKAGYSTNYGHTGLFVGYGHLEDRVGHVEGGKLNNNKDCYYKFIPDPEGEPIFIHSYYPICYNTLNELKSSFWASYNIIFCRSNALI